MDKYLIIGSYSIHRLQANMASIRPDPQQRVSCHLDTILFFHEWILFNLEPYLHASRLLLNTCQIRQILSTNMHHPIKEFTVVSDVIEPYCWELNLHDRELLLINDVINSDRSLLCSVLS